MYSYLFIFLAAICNALMDKIETIISFNTSIFRGLNKGFWCKVNSANTTFIPLTHYKVDAWHLSKSAMIIFWALAIIYYKPFIPILDFLVIGSVWNLTFNTFYNHIFKS